MKHDLAALVDFSFTGVSVTVCERGEGRADRQRKLGDKKIISIFDKDLLHQDR